MTNKLAFAYSYALLPHDDMLPKDLCQTTSHRLSCLRYCLHCHWVPYGVGLSWIGKSEDTKLLLPSLLAGTHDHGTVCHSGKLRFFTETKLNHQSENPVMHWVLIISFCSVVCRGFLQFLGFVVLWGSNGSLSCCLGSDSCNLWDHHLCHGMCHSSHRSHGKGHLLNRVSVLVVLHAGRHVPRDQ